MQHNAALRRSALHVPFNFEPCAIQQTTPISDSSAIHQIWSNY
jgi:hypothetical protein